MNNYCFASIPTKEKAGRIANPAGKAIAFIFVCLTLYLCLVPVIVHAAKLEVPPPPENIYSTEMLKGMADNVTRTGVSMDAIPALYRPQFLNVSDANLSMEHDEPVFIVTFPTGLTRIYPQRIIVWHEVINDVLPLSDGRVIRADTPLSALDAFTITYSPLTGCVAAYHAMVGRFPSTFGVTGELFNSNSLIYDRMTASTWTQLTGTCIDGPMLGKRLSPIQVTWAIWKGARERYPDAQVLSRSTGHKRNYGRDPYGSYQRSGNYYDDLRLLFPVQMLDTRLPPKKRILGIEWGGVFGALQLDAVREAGIINFTLALTPMVAFWDDLLKTAHVFERRVEGSQAPVTFSLQEGKIVDSATKGEWTNEGLCSYGKLREKKLTPVLNTNAMWFAWASFYPQTVILPETSFVRPVQ